MGTLTLQVVGDATVGTKTKTFTISDADINRLVAYAKLLAANGGITNPTVAQGLAAWSDRVVALTKRDVLAYEQNQAMAPISEITAT